MLENKQLSFKKVLSASVQDMRNSVGQVMHKIEGLQSHLLQISEKNELIEVQYEMIRMQNVINQLHGLYLIENDSLTVQMQETYVLEVLEDTLATMENLFDSRGISVEIEADDLCWYLDANLISSVLQIIILNAFRYTKDLITITLSKSEQGLQFSISDNGNGYPELVLQGFENMLLGDSIVNVTSQNAGWYYCEKIASLHKNQGRVGSTKLSNDMLIGGGRIDLIIP